MTEEDENISKEKTSEAKEYFEQYWRYCSTLRNWFVAFGIGGCVLLMGEKAGIKTLSGET